ncbi:MAG: hypothetical protein HYX68_14845 [Planctomycetes bacterium]|nr:hypothetical protein [Planctomycetota bacterium]
MKLNSFLAAILFLGLSFAGNFPTGVDAHEPTATPSAHADPTYYTVLYRHDNHQPWRSYGQYGSHHEADRAADHLRHQGHEVRVVRD